MVRVILLVEGGGDSNSQLRRYGDAFRQLLVRALGRERARRVDVRLCGDRGKTFGDFKRLLKQPPLGPVVMLVDAEKPVDPDHGPWRHVQANRDDRWERPAGAGDDSLHFMCQSMEAWVLASCDDAPANVENLDKNALIKELKAVFGGQYRKTDGFMRLERADHREIARRCPRFAGRFFKCMAELTV